MPAIIGDYFRENRESTSTTACNAFSGWSPGIKEAIAITAVRSAVTAPSTPSQSTLSKVGMNCSMPLTGCQKLKRRLINSHTVLTTAPDTSASSHSFVLIVWASRSMLVSRPWYSPRLACERSSKSRITDWRVSILAIDSRTRLNRSESSTTWSVLIGWPFLRLPRSLPFSHPSRCKTFRCSLPPLAIEGWQ
jgi:hypothetical protein